MREESDAELLREYAEGGNEGAFRELVARHTDLVYSAALRQAASPENARDVAQSVFTDLARKAQSVLEAQRPRASLAGWLYRSTRFAALNQLRQERRRQARERQVMQFCTPAPESTTDWDSVRPVLDEAMSDLGDEDREALLLRFFQNRDFRAIGQSLGVSDDATQKRVSRALEKLRAEFARRGVTTTAVALSTVISGQAVTAAPAGLAATLSSTALAGATVTTAAATTTQAIAMTTIQKALLATTLVVLAGGGIYEAHQATRLQTQNRALQQAQTSLTEQNQQLQSERERAKEQLAALVAENGQAGAGQPTAEVLRLRGEVAQLRRQLAQSQSADQNANDPFTRSVLDLAARAGELNQYVEQNPEKKIPEMLFLTPNDWLNAAKGAQFDTDADIRKALRRLRSYAKSKFPMGKALNLYLASNHGQLPTDLAQLKPFLKTTAQDDPDWNWIGVDPARQDSLLDAILDRYKLVQSGNVTNLPPNAWLVVEKAPVDKDYDSRAKFGNGRSSVTDTGLGEAGDPEDKSY